MREDHAPLKPHDRDLPLVTSAAHSAEYPSSTTLELTGYEHTFPATRKSTRDGGDGTAILIFETQSSRLPAEYIAAPQNTMFRVRVVSQDHHFAVHAARLPIRDLAKNAAEIRFAILASSLPAELLYGHRNTPVEITLAISSDGEQNPYPFDLAERRKILKQACVLLNDPQFAAWLEQQCLRLRLPIIMPPIGGKPAHEALDELDIVTSLDRATEYLYRLTRIHSRGEILESGNAAVAVRNLVHAYRQSLWDQQNAPRALTG